VSFDLQPPYENPIEQAVSELASTAHVLMPSLYESDGDALFATLVRGAYIYVEAWLSSGASNTLAGAVLTAEDLADPDRANDPHATFLSLLNLALEAVYDNIEYELEPRRGGAV
jgi:hypothetical protein